MAKEDEEKMAFITSQGVFCYSKMPFGLKNAGATYQRLVDKAFQKQIGKNLEVYVDDPVIKSRMEHEIIKDMEETFKTLREINMKLNPKKCTFGIEEGMFLGYKVNTEGIMVCLNKVRAVLNLSSPKCLKDIQKLNGKLASLNRFLSKSAEKSLPFFKTLKKCTKKSDFQWTAEAEAAFKEMKKLITELQTLTAPMEKKELIVYLMAVHALQDQPIKQILSRPEVTGRLQKWSIELGTVKTRGRRKAAEMKFDATNKEAEYEALIAGLRITEQMGVKNLQTNVDSRLVANQVNGSYIAKEPGMIQYLEKVKTFSTSFKKFSIKQVLIEELKEKSINEAEVLAVAKEEGDTWMTPIYNYLTEEPLPVSLRFSANTQGKGVDSMITLFFTLCEEQVIWNSVLMRFIDDLLALDSIVHFGFSDRRLEQTATFSISTNSE
ncbi:reverse transcriptase domain-containing protein [Tanacetum coccineum]|uniref:Reverse transcriptase domain-containing protein n=1 Tax=Tanacetum coccineum TaxID=301880 RepID=A0ABQ5H3W4_9ASTR